MTPGSSGGHGLRRRTLLGSGVGAALAGSAAALTAAGPAGPVAAAAAQTSPGPRTVAFYGDRQAGVTTPPQTHTRWVALDLARGSDLADLRRVLRMWTQDLARITQGVPPLADHTPELTLDPAHLSVTVGLGRSAFARLGRLDLAPPWLRELPSFATDALQDRWSGGDVVLQIGSSSLDATARVQRALVRAAGSTTTSRWTQAGHRGPSPEPSWAAQRNAFGQVDGTVQPAVDGLDDDLLWRDASSGAWEHASTLVLRRVAMNLDTWEQLDPVAKEAAIGRRLADGAPLTGGRERTPPDLHATDADGLTVIDPSSHMARAMPREPWERFLRRPYSFELPGADDVGMLTRSQTARSAQGLLFAAYCADAHRQYVPVQRRLAEADLLNIWTVTTGSTLVAVLPGVHPGEALGERVLDG